MSHLKFKTWKNERTGFYVHDVSNTEGDKLGRIWFKDNKYVWEQFSDTIMDKGCMRDLTEYMEKLL